MRWLGSLGRVPSRTRTLTLTLAAPAVSTVLALLAGSERQVVATSVYLLGVVIAAAFGGRAAGLAAAGLSFLGLNFFFTAPRYTFRVDKGEDLIALVLFLVVAAIVGTLLAIALREGRRSAIRERETAVTSFVGVRLLAGAPLEIVLWRFVEALVEWLDLARCQIDAAVGDRRFEAEADGEGRQGERISSALVAGERVFGSLSVVRRDDVGGFDDDEARLLRVAAEQVAIALEREVVDHGLTRLGGDRPAGPSTFPSVVAHATFEPTAVPELIDEVMGRLRSVLTRFRVRTVIRPDLPEVSADPTQLAVALSNVLENAARFSPPGGEIVVTAARWRDAVRVGVADQGPGISHEERERVLEPFYRRAVGSVAAGPGLGLAIVRAITQAHGGRLTIESSPTGGALVWIEIPVATIGGAIG